MNLFLAFVTPVLIRGFVYVLIIENKGLPMWMERLSDNSGSIWTYGVIAITVISILKFWSGN